MALVYVPNINVLIDDGGKGYQISSLANGPGKSSVVAGTTNNTLLLYNGATKSYSVIDTTGFANEVTACYYDSVANQYIYSSSILKVIKNGKCIVNNQLAAKDIAPFGPGAYALAFSNGCGVYLYPGAKHTAPWINNLEQTFLNMALLPVSARARAVAVNPADTTVYAAYVKGLYNIKRGVPTEINYNSKPIICTSLKWYKNQLYIATYTQGILCYNPATKTVSTVLASNATQLGVLKLEAYKNRLFFVTERGLYAYNLSAGKLDFWNQADGLPETEIADLIVKNDTAWLATHSGLVMLDINTPAINTTAPPIFLTGILSNGKPVSINNLPELPYKNNTLDVSFSIPAYKGGTNIKVVYKLNDNAWETLPAGNRVLQFKSLASGGYMLQVKALNEDGIESAQPLQLNFRVAQPYYQTRWFILLLLMVVVAAGWLVYKYRINKLIKKQKAELERQELKRQLDESTLKTLRAQMNPHFIHNALNSIQSYVYSGEKELASKYLGLFSDLSRSLLDSSSLTEITLHDEIKLIELYLQLECIRLPKIQYSITKQPGIQEYVITIPAMILQPLVENAVNHGFANKTENCQLQIHFSTVNNMLVVVIEDNGIGRVKSAEINARKNKKYQSFSTQAIQDRITILNKNRQRPIIQVITDLYDAHNNPAGTSVKLSIPIEDND
ncbi:MAG: histidine kinase [Sphingobacteriales bacterium JAD_PAG50586_3]|nr:MAG: histidine kinase [Sphingobacteriales bacterium JAD_PAG50586_3]